MNKITMQIKGANFPTLLRELNNQNIILKNVKRQSPTLMQITIKNKQKSKFIAILNKKCYTIVSQKNSQQNSILKPFQNLSIIVGIIFGLLLNVFATFFVWNVELFGNDELKPLITKALSDNGIKRFTLKSNASNQKIKNIIYDNIKDVSLVSVSQKGTTIFVNYTKKVSLQEKSNQKENIVAKNDGVIASILTTSGTPLVKIGDYVKKGQILILGETSENNGTQNILASGHVFAYVWVSSTFEFPLKTLSLIRTGRKVVNEKVVFQNSVLFENKNENNFQKSETEEKTIYLTNKVLPIKKIIKTTYELEEMEITQEFDEQNKEKELCKQRHCVGKKLLETKTS